MYFWALSESYQGGQAGKLNVENKVLSLDAIFKCVCVYVCLMYIYQEWVFMYKYLRKEHYIYLKPNNKTHVNYVNAV